MSVEGDAAQDAYQDWSAWQNEWHPAAVIPLRSLRRRLADKTYEPFTRPDLGWSTDRGRAKNAAMAIYLTTYVAEWENLEAEVRPEGAVAPTHILERMRPEALGHVEEEAMP